MRIRKQPLGDRNICGKKVEARRKEIGMKQKDLLTQLQIRGVDLNASGLSKLEGQIRSVSDFELVEGELEGESFDSGIILVTPAQGVICSRCWQVVPEVNEEELCPRCHEILNK